MSDDQNTKRDLYGRDKKYPTGHPFYDNDAIKQRHFYFRRELISETKKNKHIFSDFDEFFEIAPIGFATITGSCLIKDVNEAFLDMTEINEEEIINKKFTDYIIHYDKDKFLNFIRDIENRNNK